MQAILNVGMQLQGRYRIERPISAGGMGEVYKATDLTSGMAVAIKRLILTIDESLTAAGGSDYHFKRFREEIKVLQNLNYQGIPRFVDELSEDGQQFIVMEFIDGVDRSEERRVGKERR